MQCDQINYAPKIIKVKMLITSFFALVSSTNMFKLYAKERINMVVYEIC
jgi:hypothetical protein